MKKLCILFLAILLLPSLAGTVEIHPNPTDSRPSEYNGTWILDGYETVEDSPWVLELAPDGSFSMTSDSQSLTGQWELLPDPFGHFGDSLLMDINPPGWDENDFSLFNQAFGLRDSARGFVFVRPGRKADPYKEEGTYYSKEQMVGDWRLVAVHAVAGPLEVSLTAEELLSGTGETDLIINFDGGHLNGVSSVKELVIRTVLYTTEQEHQAQHLCDYLDSYQRVKAYTTGEDLKARGLPPSPRYDTILKELKAAWLDGKVNTYEEEISLLDRLIEAE